MTANTPTPTTTRRSKAMPTDGPTAKFLYAIIKQLDLKSIDWSAVAAQLEISNGHAARMRYSRFRQQMEGTTSTPRGPRPRKNPKKPKGPSCKADLLQERHSPDPQLTVKHEYPVPASFYGPPAYVKTDPHPQEFRRLADIPETSSQTSSHAVSSVATLPTSQAPNAYHPMNLAPAGMTLYNPAHSFSGPVIGFERHPMPNHVWAPVKSGLMEEGEISEVYVKIEDAQDQVMGCGSGEVEYYGLFTPGLNMAVDHMAVDHRG
ncbi:hypothetical protein BDV25DRAFT_137874 [Aspergillus avenaceus]|uniref:Myb-like DNA-binding domain-containing protein n=1 Tax=Aspergillus avenaceus TaxID=36643 RepID=A0A5N6U1E3_ASPAV|nr:hypothetical protein BDV25DRAFT_137874 [Aspergillus avenaceus]